MKAMRNCAVVLVALLTVVCTSCGTGGTRSEETPREFLGVRMGDDSAAVVKALRKNKIVRLDSIVGGAGWMHFMRKPAGYILFDDELWEMVSVHLADGKTNVIRLTNSYPTRQQAEKEYRGAARRLSGRHQLRMTNQQHEDFVIMKCIATTKQGGVTFALTKGRSVSGNGIYNVVMEYY